MERGLTKKLIKLGIVGAVIKLMAGIPLDGECPIYDSRIHENYLMYEQAEENNLSDTTNFKKYYFFNNL